MTTINPIVREVRRFLRDEYGVTETELSQGGGGHPRLAFDYGGTPHKITLPNPGHDRGLAGSFKFQDIRRLLGPPTRSVAQHEKRRLDDMMPEPVAIEARPMGTLGEAARIVNKPDAIGAHPRTADKVYRGSLAVYITPSAPDRTRLKVNICNDLYTAFSHTGALRIIRVDADTFQIEPYSGAGRKTPCFHREGNGWGFAIEKLVPVEEGAYGASPAEMILVDGSIVARVLERRPAGKPVPRRTKPVAETPPTPTVKVNPVLAAPPPSIHLETEMRNALATIRRVEAATPYRLIRVKDDEGGHWAFSAPRIE